jgi:hypothetical protein
MFKLKEEKKKMEEERTREEEPANCTLTMADPERMIAKEDRVLGLQIMGVLTLCSVLVALGWGSMTSILVITAKAGMTKSSSKATDACTSTEETAPGSPMRTLKPAVLSFRDERTRWEWPRRPTPAGRRARRARVWGVLGQADWRECVRQEESEAAGLPKTVEEV